MAELQRDIKPSVKRRLYEEAGNKCANPGCSIWRTHIHHIKQWAVYKAHNTPDMIAICPSCHDEVHHGVLGVTDDVLYSWKSIKRSKFPDTAQIHVEPASNLKLLVGSIALSTNKCGRALFKFSDNNKLSIRILDEDIIQVTSRVHDLTGRQVLRVVENHIRVVRDRSIKFDFRAGHARVTVPSSKEYIPDWVIQMMRAQDPTFANDGRVTAFDIEVLKPGLIRVKGLWVSNNNAIVITQSAFSFCQKGNLRPLSFVGDGEESCLNFTGSIDRAMFGVD